MIKFSCPSCGKNYTIGEELFGKRVQCKKCGDKIRLPSKPEGDDETLPASATLAPPVSDGMGKNEGAYRHQSCQGITSVMGEDFYYVANIFSPPHTTFCQKCNDHLPLAEFEWVHSGEPILHFHARHRAKFQGIDRWLGWDKFIFAGIALGGGVGLILGGAIGTIWGGTAVTVCAIGLAVVGAGIGFAVTGTIAVRTLDRVLGTSDFTKLT
ncbi:zinc ribbon domain-containing protein [Bremerella sp. T1]|uniref:hypothetical protein n=1 Tax=Bremerella sp. TYQ1 TaxID=3119568 RepID=UPI001CCF409E|nr:hypothetical protein [Bremerella volcania]UBM37846.1 hypothetical protein LA756_08115 [Bremerella volcania]